MFGFPVIVQDPALDQLIDVANSLVSAARTTFQRRVLVLAGDATRMRMFAHVILSRWQQSDDTPACPSLWVGTPDPRTEFHGGTVTTLSAAKALKLLGGEYRHIVFDAWEGFNPDAFCAITGALVGGGVLICITPPLSSWQHDPDYRRMVPHGYTADHVSHHFLSRMADGFQQGGVITLWNDDNGCLVNPPPDASREPTDSPLPAAGACVLNDQNALLETLASWPEREPAPCVITADRGRGKTALLGRVAARWLARAPLTIIVTSVMPSAAQQVLDWVERERAAMTGTMHCQAEGSPAFMAPDALLQHAQPIDVVLVDEAAMLPISVLQQLIMRFPRIVLASTVHGYEGSGRGMALKLFPWLDRVRPGWLSLQMRTPIRWAEHDPLERWLGELFCLNDELPDRIDESASWQVRSVSGNTLQESPALLHAVFGLLVSAHYRTTPSDLRDLLDGPNLLLWVLEVGHRVAGVCLVALEGPFDDDALCEAILAGARRPRGHLLPQVMAFHCHSPVLLRVPCARVVRIAVTPGLQGKGWGGRLLRSVEAALSALQVQVLGSSFALEPPVLHFWQRHGLRVLRIGATRESASGLPSCLVAKALPGASAVVQGEVDALQVQFCLESPRTCPGAVVLADACRNDVVANASLPAWRLQARIARFVAGGLPFESALGALWRAWPGLQAVRNVCLRGHDESDASLRALNDLVEGREDLAGYAHRAGVKGRDQAIASIRRIFAVLRETGTLDG